MHDIPFMYIKPSINKKKNARTLLTIVSCKFTINNSCLSKNDNNFLYKSRSSFSFLSLSDNVFITMKTISTMHLFEAITSILMIVSSIIGLICACIFILIVIKNQQCHTLTIYLVLNSTIAGLIANLTCFTQGIYQLLDLGHDYLCTIRGLLLQVTTGMLYHTLCVQALHRLFVTVYANRRCLQTKRSNIWLIVGQWTFSILFGLPICLTDRIQYQSGSRICQVKSILSFVCNVDFLGFIWWYNWFYLFFFDDFHYSVDFNCFNLFSNRSIRKNKSILSSQSKSYSQTTPSTIWTSSYTSYSFSCYYYFHSRISLFIFLFFNTSSSVVVISISTPDLLSFYYIRTKREHAHESDYDRQCSKDSFESVNILL